MEALTLSPSQRKDTLLPAQTTPFTPEVYEFYRQHPELLGLFDTVFEERLQEYQDATAYEDIVTPSADVQQEELKDALTREKSFFAKTYVAAMAIESGRDKVALMFDVDDTLIQPGINVARPAFALLVNKLAEQLGSERLEVGLLTTIKQEHLSTDANYLEDVKKFVNSDLFVSASVEQKNDVMHHLAQAHPKQGFVYVDDIRMTTERLRGSNVRGVWVGPEVHDEMMRFARMAA